mmetsp:Transcript_6776/g.27631  ORF Transcript_6776/g.27631 Transcript_6776/m.27631 type:complete len:206 (+) Transcript_6776:7852-8469(+)
MTSLLPTLSDEARGATARSGTSNSGTASRVSSRREEERRASGSLSLSSRRSRLESPRRRCSFLSLSSRYACGSSGYPWWSSNGARASSRAEASAARLSGPSTDSTPALFPLCSDHVTNDVVLCRSSRHFSWHALTFWSTNAAKQAPMRFKNASWPVKMRPSFWSKYMATGSSRRATCAKRNPSWCTYGSNVSLARATAMTHAVRV